MGCTLAPPGKYHWTVHLRRRCGPLSNYFYDHLLILLLSLISWWWRSLCINIALLLWRCLSKIATMHWHSFQCCERNDILLTSYIAYRHRSGRAWLPIERTICTSALMHHHASCDCVNNSKSSSIGNSCTYRPIGPKRPQATPRFTAVYHGAS